MHIHSSMAVMPSSVSAVFFVVLCKVCNCSWSNEWLWKMHVFTMVGCGRIQDCAVSGPYQTL